MGSNIAGNVSSYVSIVANVRKLGVNMLNIIPA